MIISWGVFWKMSGSCTSYVFVILCHSGISHSPPCSQGFLSIILKVLRDDLLLDVDSLPIKSSRFRSIAFLMEPHFLQAALHHIM